MQAVDASGNVLAETQPTDGSFEGAALEIPSGAAKIRVNTGKRITGAVNTQPGGGK